MIKFLKKYINIFLSKFDKFVKNCQELLWHLLKNIVKIKEHH